MGFDTEVCLLWGFKFQLSEVFTRGWLKPSIMEDDDWQLINMGEEVDRIVEESVLNSDLKKLLKTGWSLYILTTGNGDCEPEKSYLFLYMSSQDIEIKGNYGTGEVDIFDHEKLPFQEFDILGLDIGDWKWHWVMKHSW